MDHELELRFHPVLRDYFNLRPVEGGGEFQRRNSPPQDPHRDGEQRKVKNTRFNIFGEPAGHDPEARGSDRDGELWNEPDGGNVNHLLLEGEEEGEEQEQEEEPQLENLTETAYTSGGEPTEDEITEDARMMVMSSQQWKIGTLLAKRWRPTEFFNTERKLSIPGEEYFLDVDGRLECQDLDA